MTYMSSFHSRDHLSKVCALVAATLILPVLALAGTYKGNGNNGNQYGKFKDPPVSVVRSNAGGVDPFFGIVLLFRAQPSVEGDRIETAVELLTCRLLFLPLSLQQTCH
jgi:hypothetical protein